MNKTKNSKSGIIGKLKAIGKLPTLTKCLIAIFLFIIAFDAVMIPIYYHFAWNMDILITCNLGGGIIEAFFTMIITVFKIKNNKEDS